ncbi:tyrosine/serine phosphatase-like protein [Lineolata rhizophorae]|uniref:Tyrosine/serine phosphatase-like protein n=1 Tax=Lineolata rhizophorae TaxID=578093 RepID=A0A6A6NYU1_9PEZI|nr:tyrosine/serine phosphatase-like protein [Lineolata rhizophorae]
MSSSQPQPAFETLLNFRDVGVTVNGATNSDLVKPGKLYRSARPDRTSLPDRRRLLEDYGLKSVLDLRTDTELLQQAERYGADVHKSALNPDAGDKASLPLQIAEAAYHHVNFNGHAYSMSLMQKLSWLDIARVMGNMALGYRTDAIKILGTKVMCERGLVGLGIDSIDVCHREVLDVFDILADEKNYPILVHCTQGKDRTGLVVMLCLMLLGVPVAAIDRDYMMSEPELLLEKEERMKEIGSIGLTEEFAGCPTDFVETIFWHISEKYGGIEEYLIQVGVSEEKQARIKEILRS